MKYLIGVYYAEIGGRPPTVDHLSDEEYNKDPDPFYRSLCGKTTFGINWSISSKPSKKRLCVKCAQKGGN